MILDTRGHFKEVFFKEQHQNRLFRDMMTGGRIFDKFSGSLEKLKILSHGFNEGSVGENPHSLHSTDIFKTGVK